LRLAEGQRGCLGQGVGGQLGVVVADLLARLGGKQEIDRDWLLVPGSPQTTGAVAMPTGRLSRPTRLPFDSSSTCWT
jgi:hypothetical protein